MVHIERFDPSENIETIVTSIKSLRNHYPALKLNIIGSHSSGKFQEHMELVKSKFLIDGKEDWLTFTPIIERKKF